MSDMPPTTTLTADDWAHIKELIQGEMKTALADVVTKDALKTAIEQALDTYQDKTRAQLQVFDVYLRQAETNMRAAQADMKEAAEEFRQTGRNVQTLAAALAAKQAALEEADKARAEQMHAVIGQVQAQAIREDHISEMLMKQGGDIRRIRTALFGDKSEDGPESLFKMVSELSFQIEQVGARVNGIDQQMKLDNARWEFVKRGGSALMKAAAGPVGRWVVLLLGSGAIGGAIIKLLELVGGAR
jgi:ferritin-like metal-binding protein YciE